MNWKIIRWALLCLLLALNLGLLGYNTYLNTERYVVPAERITLLQEQYRREGYILPETLPTKQYPMERLIFKKENLESRADGFWTEEYEKSYMIGSKVLYTCGSQTLTVDRDTSSMVYIQNEPVYDNLSTPEEEEAAALAFARRMTQKEELILLMKQETQPGAYTYFFCETYKKQPVFSNETAVTVCRGAVVQAAMTQYGVEEYESETQYIYPIDEVLYGSLQQLGSTGTTMDLTLYYGYLVTEIQGDTAYGAPHILILCEDGRYVLTDQYTVEFHELPY